MFISRPDAQLFAIALGGGPRTIVGMGGWVGSWELWCEPFARLSPSWRAIAYDHRGAGATIAAPESITFSALVNDLFAVLDTYGLNHCVLAAESAGAATALQAVLDQPQRFDGLVLVDALYYRERPAGTNPFLDLVRTNFHNTLATFVDNCVPERASAEIRHWGRQIVWRSTPEAAVRLYESLYDTDLRPRLKSITQPVLLIHGARDRIVPLTDAEWLAAQLPNSQLVVLPDAGHVPTLTQPQVIADAINRFFGA